MARRRPPPRGRGAARGRAAEPGAPPPPKPRPFWERVILSRGFRVVVGATLASAAIAIAILVVGPVTIGGATGAALAFVASQTGRLGQLSSVAIASAIQDEGRKLWAETATPLPSPTPRNTPLPTSTPFPTPPPPRRQLTTPVAQAPEKPAAVGGPAVKAPPLQLPIEDAVSATREYFQILGGGEVRRAMQYWAPDAAPEARSALDASVDRGERYEVRKVTPRQLPGLSAVDMVVEMEITEKDGKKTVTEQRYQWRLIEGQWYITSRLQ